MPERVIAEHWVRGWRVYEDVDLGHLWVHHSGSITWDHLQAIKNAVWGDDARAIEVYPAQSELVDTKQVRHLWRLGPFDFAPDLLGRSSEGVEDGLQARFERAWVEAR